jgi:NADPH-dependent 2,4-dienoyl-CoA reductase/sulfur reductase-like enzyme
MRRSVIIIGGGPAGLTAARVLREGGIADVLVLERDREAGGVPRYCGHPGFGLIDFQRIWSGPDYARRLVEATRGTSITTGATVLGLEPGGRVRVSTSAGLETLEAQAVLLATGARETPRSARLISGSRPWGVTTTGAFQEMVYAGGMRPFARPVVVGSELVSFSALLTARHARISPVAMIEEADRIAARGPSGLITRALFGVPLLTGARLAEIRGDEHVESVVVERHGTRTVLPCDAVIFSGRFVPEAALVRTSHLTIDPSTGGPAIDSNFRCSDPAFFAAGNVLRAVEHAGMVSTEGRLAALAILRALRGSLPESVRAIPLEAGAGLRYAYPQRVVPEAGTSLRLFARAARPCRGVFRLLADGVVVAERRGTVAPERRLTLTLPAERVIGSSKLEAVLDER